MMDETIWRGYLTSAGWVDNGTCSGCTSKRHKWTNQNRPDEVIKTARAAGYFYHMKSNYTLKADYLENLKRYLDTLT